MRLGVLQGLDPYIGYSASQLFPVYLVDIRRDVVYMMVTQPATPDQNQIITLYCGSSLEDTVRGAFRLGIAFDWTERLSRGMAASTFQAYIQKLVTIGTGNVSVTKVTNIQYTIEFIGDLANTYVAPFAISNDTSMPAYIGETYWLTGEFVYARMPINPWFSYGGYTPTGTVLTLLPSETLAGSITLKLTTLLDSRAPEHFVNIPVESTPEQIKELINADSYMGYDGVSVLGGPLSEGQVQIRLNSSAYFTRISKGTGNGTGDYKLILCDRTTTLSRSDREDSIDWTIIGASWTY